MKLSQENSEKVELLLDIMEAEGIITEKERRLINKTPEPNEIRELSDGLVQRRK